MCTSLLFSFFLFLSSCPFSSSSSCCVVSISSRSGGGGGCGGSKRVFVVVLNAFVVLRQSNSINTSVFDTLFSKNQ